MKIILIASLMMLTSLLSVSAQEITAPEPEFVNSYCILTSSETYDILPKENGTLERHESKSKKTLSKIKNLADAAILTGGIGAVVGARSGAGSAVKKGIDVMRTASNVGSLASTASGLAGSVGMDVVFKGSSSSYVYHHDGNDIRLLIKAENNEQDPMDIYRIIKFDTDKKSRRIQWMEVESSLLGSLEAKESGFINFSAHKYGQQSYLLSLAADDIEPGEYGIFFMNVITATAIPVGTFSVQ